MISPTSMHILWWSFVALIWIGPIACQSTPSGYTSGREHYTLTEREQTRLEKRAANGDERAAVRLLEFHLLVTGDQQQIERWRRRVEELRRKHTDSNARHGADLFLVRR